MNTDIQAILDTLADTINLDYDYLVTARSKLLDAQEDMLDAKTILEATKVCLINSGEIEGKNQQQRDASAREQLAEEYERLETKEKLFRYAKSNYDVAQFEVNRTRASLRIMEIIIKHNECICDCVCKPNIDDEKDKNTPRNSSEN